MVVNFNHLRFTVCLVVTTFVVGIAAATKQQTFTDDNRHYPHGAYLDESETVLFKWRVAATRAGEQQIMPYLDAEISAPILGYIGWGISPNGGMPGADILLMWVDDATGTAHIQDRYADAFAEPKLDDDQSSILDFEGYQNATHTTFRFRRELDAGCTDSKHDLSIPPSAAHIIFALGERDVEASADAYPGGHAAYHGRLGRGSRALYIREDSKGQFESDRTAALAETTEIIEIRSADVRNQKRHDYFFRNLRVFMIFHAFMHVKTDFGAGTRNILSMLDGTTSKYNQGASCCRVRSVCRKQQNKTGASFHYVLVRPRFCAKKQTVQLFHCARER